VEPATDQQQGPWQIARTNDGGTTWTYSPAPCGYADLAYNGDELLLVCTQGRTASQEFDVYRSGDEGRTWESMGADPFVGGYFGTLTNVGSTFVAAMSRGDIWSSTDGRSWRRDTEVGEGFWKVASVPGVGAWAVNSGAEGDPNSGVWFSADGIHWQQRGAAAP
jgi:hypothetical protein